MVCWQDKGLLLPTLSEAVKTEYRVWSNTGHCIQPELLLPRESDKVRTESYCN